MGEVAATTSESTVADTGEYRWSRGVQRRSYNNAVRDSCGSEVTQIFAKDDLLVGKSAGKAK